MHRPKKQCLDLKDIAVLALIFFGHASFSSTMMYLDLYRSGHSGSVDIAFSDADNLRTIVMELASLAVAALYLRWRQFDFRVLDFSVNRWTLPLTALLIASAGLTADVLHYASQTLDYYLAGGHGALEEQGVPHAEVASAAHGMAVDADGAQGSQGAAGEDAAQSAPRITPLLLLACALNGFYEEVFFLGLVFAARPGKLRQAIVLSLFVRYAFHTYQGLVSAFIITSLGPVFVLFRRHIRSLVPFVLAHAVFDVFGLSLLRIAYSAVFGLESVPPA